MSSDLSKIGHQFNYDDNYFRMVVVGLAKTLNRYMRWVYRFETQKVCVSLPVFTTMTGEQRFLLDSFVDDITDKRVELNTDVKPRGVINLESWGPVSDEYANPNIYVPKTVRINRELKRIVTKIKAIPIQFSFNFEIHMTSENDIYLINSKILDMMYNYYFFSIDYYGLKIDSVLFLPDDKTVEQPRNIPIDNETRDKIMKIPITVKSYYPSWKVDTDRLDCGENIEFENMKKVFFKAYIHSMKKLRDLSIPNINDPDFQRSEGVPPHNQSTPQEDFDIPPEFYDEYEKTRGLPTIVFNDNYQNSTFYFSISGDTTSTTGITESDIRNKTVSSVTGYNVTVNDAKINIYNNLGISIPYPITSVGQYNCIYTIYDKLYTENSYRKIIIVTL